MAQDLHYERQEKVASNLDKAPPSVRRTLSVQGGRPMGAREEAACGSCVQSVTASFLAGFLAVPVERAKRLVSLRLPSLRSKNEK